MADSKLNIQITAEDMYSAVLRGVEQGMKNAQKATEGVGKQLNATSINAAAFVVAIQGAYQAVSQFVGGSISAAVSFEKFDNQMKAAVGAQAAAKEMAFVRAEADRLGLSLPVAIDGFTKLAASTKGTSLEGEGTRKIFSAVSEAARAMGLSSEESGGAILALSQMASKGKVSMEELRGQLGERVPGAMQIAARAMGVTTGELQTMVEKGMDSSLFLSKFADQLHNEFGDAASEASNGAAAGMERFNNAILESKASLGASLLPAIKGITPILSGIVGLGAKIIEGWQIIGTTAGKVASNLENLFRFMSRQITWDQYKKQAEMIENTYFEAVDSIHKQYQRDQGNFQKTEEEKAAEAKRTAEKLKTEAQSFADDKYKIEMNYKAKVGGIAGEITATYMKSYQEDKKAIEAKYAEKLTTLKKGSLDEANLQRLKNSELAALDLQHSKDTELIEIDRQSRLLTAAKAGSKAQIEEIKLQAEKHVISSREAADKVAEIELEQAQETARLAGEKFKIISKLYNEDTKEYQDALKAKESSLADANQKEIAALRQQEVARKQILDNQLAAAENSYEADLNSLQEFENDKTVSCSEATLRRLQLERDYTEKIASLRSQELSQYDPQTQTKEYEAALAAKLGADRDYLSAKKALNDEEANQLVESTKKAVEAADAWKEEANNNFNKFQEEGASFAAWWAGVWDEAYNNASTSLKQLSDAAYNTFAGLHDLPMETVESLETLKQKADEAHQNFLKLYNAANHAALTVTAGWSDAYRALNMIPAEAARITAEFYNQKVAAEELAQAIEEPANATETFVQQSEWAIDKLKLLDNTTLDKLKSSVQKIKDSILAFTDAVKDSLKSLQDEWDSMSMSKLQLEEKRYNEEKAKWQEDMAKAQAQNNADAVAALQQQLDLIEKIHNATVADLGSDPANSVIPGMATGGNVGGSGTGDTQLRWLDPREWVIRPEAVSHWGTDIVAAFNAPWTNAGRFLAERINGLSVPAVSIPAPKLAMAAGGPVGSLSSGHAINLNISTTQPIDATFIRRQIIPEIDKYAKLKK